MDGADGKHGTTLLARLLSRSPLKIGLLALATVAILVGHTLTPATAEQTILHDLHRHLLYIPIILAAFWFGWRGGLLTAAVISAFFFPHLLGMLHDQREHLAMGHGTAGATEIINRALEMVIYLVVGGVTGVLIDRLRAEEDRLRHANAELAARTGQLQQAMDELTRRTREVFETEEQLRRADRLSAIGQLTTGLAHEIRNPLASIRGAAEILGDGGVPEVRRAEFSAIMLEETRRLDRVLGSFLDYARSHKAATSGAPPSSGLRAVLDTLITLLGRPLADSGVAFEADVPADLPPLALAADLLQQVLLNLALNAIQAMEGGGRLTIEARRERAGWITVRVCDSGPGIAAAVAARIFDPFFTTKPQGLGLGLAIVHKIVAGCGGRIEAETESKEGACFRLTLPTHG